MYAKDDLVELLRDWYEGAHGFIDEVGYGRQARDDHAAVERKLDARLNLFGLTREDLGIERW